MATLDIASPTQLHPIDKKPKPSVVRINKLGLIIVIVLMVSLFAIISFSIENHNINKQTSTEDTQTKTAAINPLPETFQEVSNAIPGHEEKPPNVSPGQDNTPNTNLTPDTDTTIAKRRAQMLLTAMDSPLTPSGMQSIDVSSAFSQTADNDNVSLQATPSGTTQLPLSSQQIEALSQAASELNSSDSDKNLQGQKEQFLRSLQMGSDSDYLNQSVKKPLSPYEVMAGTQIPAITAGGVNSDLPGQFTALVRQNVFDSTTGRYLLIPQGAKIIMSYDSHVAYGQNRVLVAAKRIIFPNGQSLDLEGMPGSDASGFAGLSDEVNNHYGRIFGSAALMGIISGAFQLSQPQQSNALQNPSTGQILAGAMGQQLAQVSTSMIEKNLDIQPTLMIRPGYLFNITVTADLVLPGVYQN